jgi:glycosyltransferase involved in cell wall biosynthesis
MRISLVSDAWTPQVNGVVRSLQATVQQLSSLGHDVAMVTPDLFRSIPCPTYPEIRLALTWPGRVGRLLERQQPDAIHIATEGPLGLAARRFCHRQGLAFTTAFHTRFPDYVSQRTGLNPDWFWRYLRWFHSAARHILVATPRLADELRSHRLSHTRLWGRGVDLSQFRADAPPHPAMAGLPGPIQLYVGRVAVEKNLEAFLATRVPGSRVIVGDGPARQDLERAFPDARFLGALHGEALAQAYAAADVFVFPSMTDTFGLVMIEALASGVPVAAFPVAGPLDVLGPDAHGVAPGFRAKIGAIASDLDAAILKALEANPQDCRLYAQQFSWERCTQQFLDNLTPLR